MRYQYRVKMRDGSGFYRVDHNDPLVAMRACRPRLGRSPVSAPHPAPARTYQLWRAMAMEQQRVLP